MREVPVLRFFLLGRPLALLGPPFGRLCPGFTGSWKIGGGHKGDAHHLRVPAGGPVLRSDVMTADQDSIASKDAVKLELDGSMPLLIQLF